MNNSWFVYGIYEIQNGQKPLM